MNTQLSRLAPWLLAVCLWSSVADARAARDSHPFRRTIVSIVGDEFYLNGQPAYAGRTWNGHKIQGLLMNSRMVQGIFDDRNPETLRRWAYPDTGRWDAERNTREFLAAMPEWRRHGLLAFTLNLQGGSPQGYSQDQPWHNSAIEADGSLRADYLRRLERILDRADQLGMVVILGYFYFGQDQRLQDEAAVIRATDNATQWLLERGYRNVIVEINNECNVRYDHAILKPDRVHELIDRVRTATRNGRRLYAGTSYGGGTIPKANVVRISDFLLIHGNGVSNPDDLAAMVRKTRAVPGYFPKPILFNEDDHFAFEKPKNNFIAAVSEYASWGFFDWRQKGEGYLEGYQSVPVHWGIDSERKRGFFRLLAEITGASAAPAGSSVAAGTPPKPPAGDPAAASPGNVTVKPIAYHGWTNAYVLSNGKVEAVIVPAIGRVMQFGFTGEEGVFWENRDLDGKTWAWNPDDWYKNEWINFGGDKTWPAPEADWPNHTRRATWRPPPAFDPLPVEARVEANGDVTLVSSVDPFFQVRTHRRVHLDPLEPVMTIATSYERVSTVPLRASIWVITQLKEPAGVFVPLPKRKSYPAGYVLLSKQHPPSLTSPKGLLALTRNPKSPHKIGTAAETLLWVGARHALRIDSPRVVNGEYPDQGSSAEVYTNPDPLPYVELETLGPLQQMVAGERIERVNTYTLFRRTEKEPEKEARKILAR